MPDACDCTGLFNSTISTVTRLPYSRTNNAIAIYKQLPHRETNRCCRGGRAAGGTTTTRKPLRRSAPWSLISDEASTDDRSLLANHHSAIAQHDQPIGILADRLPKDCAGSFEILLAGEFALEYRKARRTSQNSAIQYLACSTLIFDTVTVLETNRSIPYFEGEPSSLPDCLNSNGFQDDLHRADEHVAEARRFVQRQKGLIIRLRAAGVNTWEAQRILWLLESNLRRFEEHGDRLRANARQ